MNTNNSSPVTSSLRTKLQLENRLHNFPPVINPQKELNNEYILDINVSFLLYYRRFNILRLPGKLPMSDACPFLKRAFELSPQKVRERKRQRHKNLQRKGTAIKKIKERWKERIGIRMIRIKKSSARYECLHLLSSSRYGVRFPHFSPS
jgi:hypothetical protein